METAVLKARLVVNAREDADLASLRESSEYQALIVSA